MSEQCLRFSNGVFSVEVFGPDGQSRAERMQDLLNGKFATYASEVEIDVETSQAELTTLRAQLESAREFIQCLADSSGFQSPLAKSAAVRWLEDNPVKEK